MVEHFLQGQILFGQVSPEVLLQSLLNNASFCRKTKTKLRWTLLHIKFLRHHICISLECLLEMPEKRLTNKSNDIVS